MHTPSRLATVAISLATACLAAAAPAATDEPLPVNILRAPGAVVVDGKLGDWILTAPVAYEVDPGAGDRSVRTYAMWDDACLYLAYIVRDASPMLNSGADPSSAFKTGDSLHLYLGTGGEAQPGQAGGPHDFHVLMTQFQSGPVVFAFRQQKGGVDKPTLITSPATRIELAWMGEVTGAEFAVVPAADKRGYTAEARLPLAFFDGFNPAPGAAVAADVAVNFSDAAGTRNLAKVWWHRGASQILDIPTELQFDRNLWGRAMFRAAGETPIVLDNGNFYVVPAPGPVAIDGDLADWDQSCAYGPAYVDPQLKDRYNVTWLAMHDAEALYLGAVFHSAQPLANDGGVNNVWWQGDSLEFRLAADPARQGGDPKLNPDILTFGVWYNPKEGKDYVALQRSFRFEIGDASAVQVKSREVPGGRSFELRVPWSIVQSGNRPGAGDAIACTLAAIWTNGLRAYGMGSISSFRGMGDWGQAHFLAKGRQPLVFLNLPRPPESAAPAAPAKYKVAFDLPAKGLWSAGVYTADGRLLRTLFAGRTVAAPGAAEAGWDGNDDSGQPAPAGRYEVRAVLNAGLRARYITSACSPGQPPHASANPLGGWGGVWGNVIDIAADATGLYPVWAMEEGDGALLKIDEDGRILWRQHIPLALHGAQTAVASNGEAVFVSVDLGGAQAGRAGLWRVGAADGVYRPFPNTGSDALAFILEGVERPVPDSPDVSWAEGAAPPPTPAVAGLAAGPRELYVAAFHQNEVAVFDAADGKRLRAWPLPEPRGLCLDAKGMLVAVSGVHIVRLDPATGAVTPLVTAGLDAPQDVAVTAAGDLVVTDRGTSQQVKRFAPDGTPRGNFGEKGGRDNNGRFTVERLRDPAGIAVAASGRIFYSEDAPPRIFVRLSPDLAYEKLWSGPWYLSGEVTVDPQRPEHVYIWSHEAFIRHIVDYTARTSRPDAVWSDFALPRGQYARWFPRVVHHQGATYLFCGGSTVSLFRIDGDRVLLIAALGVERGRGQESTRWSFADLNENGRMDDGERTAEPQDGKAPDAYLGSYWGGSIDERDLTIYLLSGGRDVLAVTPALPKPGVPVYRFADARRIPLAAARKPDKPNTNLSSIWHAADGGVFGNADTGGSDPRGIGHSSHLSDVYVYRLDRDGKLLWRAGRKASGIAKEGEFYGRACGLAGPIGDDYFSFVDENGQDRVFTQDGLYVGSLLEDSATASPSEYTLLVEHFNSIVYRNAQDGKWYFVAGAGGYASIWEIAGLDHVSRLAQPVVVP